MSKVLKWSSGVMAAGVVLLLAVYFLRVPLVAPSLSRLVTETIRSETGVQLEIDEISGNYLSALALKGVKTIHPNSAGPLVSLDLAVLDVRYSLLALFSGLDAFLGKLRIEIDGARISLLLEEQPSESEKTAFIIPGLPPRLPSLRVTNSTIAIEGGDARTRFEGISLAIQPGRSGASLLQLAASDWSWQHPALYDRNVALSAEATLTSEGITVEKLNIGNGLVAASARIDLRQAPGELPYMVQARIFDGILNLAGTWTPSSLELQTSGERLDLTVLPTVVKLPFSGLGGSLDWDADAHLNAGSPASSKARLELSISNGQIEARTVDRIDLKARLSDEVVTIEDLTAHAAGNRLGLKNIQGPAPSLFAGEFIDLISRISGDLSFQSENLPAVLRALRSPSDKDPAVPKHTVALQGQFHQGTLVISKGHLTTASGNISLGPLQVQIPTADTPWPQSTVNGSGTVDIVALQPVGVLFGLPEIRGALKASIDVSGTLGAPQGRAAVDGKDLAWQNIAVERVALTASGSAERLSVKNLEMRHGGDRVTGQGAFNWSTGSIEEARLDLNLVDLHRYLVMLAPAIDWLDPREARIDGQLKGQFLLSGPLASPNGAADLKINGLKFQDRDFGHVIAQVSKQGDQISTKGVSLENGKDIVSIQGAVDLAAKSATALTLSARIADIGQYTRGLVPPQWAASGAIHLDAEISGPVLQPAARLQADFNQLKVGKIDVSTAKLSARSDGRLIQVDLVEVKRPHERLKLSGKIQNNWGKGNLIFDIDACDIQFHDLELTLQHPTRVDYLRSGAISFADLILHGSGGRVAVDGIFSQTGASDIKLNVNALTGSDWFAALTGDRLRFSGLDAAIHFSGRMPQPNMTATGKADSISVKDYPNPLRAEFDLSYAQKGITIQHLAVRGSAGPDLSLTGNFPVQIVPEFVLMPGPVEAAGKFSAPDLKLINAFMNTVRVKNGDLQGDFQFGGSWRQLDGRLQFRGRNVDVDTDWQLLPPGPYLVDGDLDIKGSRLTIKSLQLKGPSLTLTSQGSWSGIPSPTDLIEKAAFDPRGELAIEGKLVVPDMNWLVRGVSSLRRTAGKLEADLRLTGPVAKPDFQATVKITGGELQTNIGMPSLRAIDLSARLDTVGIQLDRLEALMGGSPVQASGTYKWKTSDPQAVDLSVKGTNLLLYRDESILMRADTDLKLQGPLERMALTGNVEITKGLVKKNLNIFGRLKGPGGPRSGSGLELFSLTEPPLRDLQFNVRLRSKSRIDIRGNIAQGSIRPDLQLGGTGLLPLLKGKIYADTTRVSLPAGRMVIKSGVIEFLETDPDVPNLELNGSSRMLGYDISILVEGPYNEPEITLSSIPPLPGDDLMLLLLTGQAPRGTLGNRGRQRQSIQVAVYVAKDLMGSLFPGSSSEELEDILDRFDFEIGRDVTRSGDETIAAQFRVKSGLILKRDRVYITGEKDTYDYYNTGIKLVFRFK